MSLTTIVTVAVIAYLGMAVALALLWAENRKLRKETSSLYTVIRQLTHPNESTPWH